VKSIAEQMSETTLRCQALEEENVDLRNTIKSMDERLDYMENQSRRNNLIFHGVAPAKKGETWTDCEKIVTDVIEQKLDLTDSVNIQRAHRIMRGKAIIVKLSEDKDKYAILKRSKALKGTKMYITEDFSLAVRQKRKGLIPHMVKARDNELKAVLRFDKLYIEDNIYTYDLVTATVAVVKRGKGPGIPRADHARAPSHEIDINPDNSESE